ncbi:MAG TPA: hypothetical protein VMI75_12885, partial [Polyangiaceae bacterium]|nr:hypothetical protein [Polyangiaceae bacterium]
TRIDLAAPLGVGLGLGLSTGIVTGMMGGPVGLVLGIAIGGIAGFFAGAAMFRDARRREARNRELDAIIGVSEGDLGAAPVAMPQEPEAGESPSTAWVAEWLTPPPPVAG